ncbi:hypothetical protein SEPCBS57363_000342 [Sporothrix epigloea]|uniref:PCI domain-containing protein n=1 Tax=Sporothrix epigloea TaxID=1892477 RepID=A0ABP0D548_9PEZI
MAQLKAMDALEPFLVLAMTASSPRQAADLVIRATSYPSTYVFAELLQCPRIQALAHAEPEHAVYLTVLQIFSYGTYADYERGTAPASATIHADSSRQSQTQASTAPAPAAANLTPLPTLNEAQSSKLRQLSLVSLATDRSSLGYDHLIKALQLTDDSQLESLVMAAVYAGLVTGTLDPAHRVVRIGSVAPVRGPAPDAIPKLHAAIHNWSQRCQTALTELNDQIAGIRRAAAARAEEAERWEAQVQRAVDVERRTMSRKEGNTSSSTNDGNNSVGKRPMTLNVSGLGAPTVSPRFNKRGSSLIASSGGPSGSSAPTSVSAHVADEEGAMDLDDDDGGDANKRNRNA